MTLTQPAVWCVMCEGECSPRRESDWLRSGGREYDRLGFEESELFLDLADSGCVAEDLLVAELLGRIEGYVSDGIEGECALVDGAEEGDECCQCSADSLEDVHLGIPRLVSDVTQSRAVP